MSDLDEIDVDVADDVSTSSSYSERSAKRKVALAAVGLFCAVVKERLKMIKNNGKVNEIFDVYLMDLLKEFEDNFVKNKRKDYPYAREPFSHLQNTPTGYEIADPDYNEPRLIINQKLNRMKADLEEVISAIQIDCMNAAINWVDHQIVLFLNHTKAINERVPTNAKYP